MSKSPADQAFARFRDRGDPSALGELFDLTATELLRVATHLTRSTDIADDLLQETFLVAIECPHTFDARNTNVQAWLLGILHNRARRRWRSRTPDSLAGRGESVEFASGEGDPLAAAEGQELSAAISDAVAALPEHLRAVLRMHLAHGMSAADIALVLERPPGTVRTQVVRGLELLRRNLPRGLSVGVLGIGLSASHLGSVRDTVLGAATRACAATTGSLTVIGVASGALMMKKMLAVFGAVFALVFFGAYGGGWLGSSSPDSNPGRLAEGLSAGEGSDDEALALPAPAKRILDDARSPLRSNDPSRRRFGAMVVRVRWRDTGALAAGVGVAVYNFGEPSFHLHRREGVTGQGGEVRIDRILCGEVQVACNDADRIRVALEEGEDELVECVVDRWPTVTGVVVDSSGAPVAGATIVRSDYGNYDHGSPVATSGRDGRFELDAAPHRYLGAYKRGFGYSHYYRLEAGTKTTPLEIRLRGPGGVVRGIVRDVQGRPVPFARVGISGAGSIVGDFNQRLVRAPGPRAESDAQGRFVLDVVPVGRHRLYVERLDYAPWGETVAVEDPATPVQLEVVLTAGAIVTGRVVVGADTPVAGASVYTTAYRARRSCTADANGRFRLDSLPVGRVKMEVQKSGIGRCIAHLDLEPGVTTNWHARLAAIASIRGRVVDARGQPLAGMVVDALTRPGSRNRGQAKTDARGEFRIEIQKKAVFRVFVRKGYADFESAVVHGVRPDGEPLLIRVGEHQLPSAFVEGKIVTEDGSPLARARVLVWKENRGRAPNFEFDSATGAFKLGPVPAGSYTVVVRGEGCPVFATERFELQAAETKNLGVIRVLPPGSFVARVFGVDGRPAADGHLAIESVGGHHIGNLTIVGGLAKARELSPGRYVALVDRELCHFTIRTGTVTSVDLRPVPPRRQPLLLVHDRPRPDGEYPPALVVEVTDDHGKLIDRRFVPATKRVGTEWRCAIAVPAAGPVTIRVRCDGWVVLRTTIAAGANLVARFSGSTTGRESKPR